MADNKSERFLQSADRSAEADAASSCVICCSSLQNCSHQCKTLPFGTWIVNLGMTNSPCNILLRRIPVDGVNLPLRELRLTQDFARAAFLWMQ